MRPIKIISNNPTITLWISQGLLATLFLSGAIMKFLMPADKLAAKWPWTADNRRLVIFTAALDALISLGLILPDLLGVYQQVTFFAALGAIALMIAAIVFHLSRNEGAQIGINIVTLVIAIVIAWTRRP